MCVRVCVLSLLLFFVLRANFHECVVVFLSLFDWRFVFYLFQMSMKRSQWCFEGKDEHKKWFYLDKIFVAFALERYVKRRDDQITAIVRQTHAHTHANSNRFRLIIANAFVSGDALCHRFWNWMLSEWSQKRMFVLVSIKKNISSDCACISLHSQLFIHVKKVNEVCFPLLSFWSTVYLSQQQ